MQLSSLPSCMGGARPTPGKREAAGMVDGAAIRAGEVWRPFTALTLHSDLLHLVSNLFFGALFVSLLFQMLDNGGAVSTTGFESTGNVTYEMTLMRGSYVITYLTK